MDSITQAALGAAIGEVTLGKSLGNKAILWGAAIATLPDLDVAAYPLMDTISELGWHRGISHSFLLSAALAPVFGYLMHAIHKEKAPLKTGMLLALLALVTHILLDAFTMYGTQLFAPFSDYRVAWNSLFIIDPFYTAPLMLTVIIALFLKRTNNARRTLTRWGLYLSTGYIVLSLIAKVYIDDLARENLHAHDISYERYITTAAPLSILLWRSLAETADGYYISYHSLFDSSAKQPVLYVPRNAAMIDSIRNSRAVQQLLWFSDGYYHVEEHKGAPVFHDLRFGEFSTEPGGGNFGYGEWKDPEYAFAFILYRDDNGNITFRRGAFGTRNFGTAFDQLLNRIFMGVGE